jgi:hypothetical protein
VVDLGATRQTIEHGRLNRGRSSLSRTRPASRSYHEPPSGCPSPAWPPAPPLARSPARPAPLPRPAGRRRSRRRPPCPPTAPRPRPPCPSRPPAGVAPGRSAHDSTPPPASGSPAPSMSRPAASPEAPTTPLFVGRANTASGNPITTASAKVCPDLSIHTCSIGLSTASEKGHRFVPVPVHTEPRRVIYV